MNRAPPAEASLIAYLWPLLIVLFSALLPGERLEARHLVGAALGFAGAATLFAGKAGGFSLAAIDPRVLSGYALGARLRLRLVELFGAVAPAEEPRRPKRSPASASSPRRSPRSAISPSRPMSRRRDAAQWAAIVGLGLGPVGLAFYVWDFGVKHGDIRLLGVAAYAAPVLSTLILVAAGFAPATLSLAPRLRADRRRRGGGDAAGVTEQI